MHGGEEDEEVLRCCWGDYGGDEGDYRPHWKVQMEWKSFVVDDSAIKVMGMLWEVMGRLLR